MENLLVITVIVVLLSFFKFVVYLMMFRDFK